MHLIKVNAIDSTNSFGREMFRENPAMKTTCIVAKEQLKGRGQRGSRWDSRPGENLTFSVVYPDPGFAPGQQFLLSAGVATSLVGALQAFDLSRLRVKWPNDILSAQKKIGGILIENVINDTRVAASVIGIGLNVNQLHFDGLETAGSMAKQSGRKFDLEEVLSVLLGKLEYDLAELRNRKASDILESYEHLLFRKNMMSTFELPDKQQFVGVIEGVCPEGKLKVRSEGELLREFDLKEVRQCY